jgi:hypothetical protein
MEVNVERLKELRRVQVLSLRELEERSGVSYNTIWRIEDGIRGGPARPWNTRVKRGKDEGPRDGVGNQRTPRSCAPRLAQSIQQEGVQPARSRAQTGD